MNSKEHLLVCAAEEAGEIATVSLALQKSISKSLRFGLRDINPLKGMENARMLAGELNDLSGVVEMLLESGVKLPGLGDRGAIEAKKAKVLRYMGLATQNGTLSPDAPAPTSKTEQPIDAPEAAPEPEDEPDWFLVDMGERGREWFRPWEMDPTIAMSALSVTHLYEGKQNNSSRQPDDLAVDDLASRMKARLAEARRHGLNGWQNRAWTPTQITKALREAAAQGNPVDVANYCAFLYARGEHIDAEEFKAKPMPLPILDGEAIEIAKAVLLQMGLENQDPTNPNADTRVQALAGLLGDRMMELAKKKIALNEGHPDRRTDADEVIAKLRDDLETERLIAKKALKDLDDLRSSIPAKPNKAAWVFKKPASPRSRG